MQLINIFMLFGLLAVAIPIIIQLLTRKTSQKIFWGAMIFIMDSMQKRRKKVLLEEILLLACRCLIPALLALALARPFIQPNSPVPWAVVLPLLLLSITLFGISFALWNYKKWRRITRLSALVLFTLASVAILFERQLNLKRFGRGAAKDVVIVIDGSASMSMLNEGESNFEHAKQEARKYIENAPKGTAFSIMLGGPVAQIYNPVPITDKRILLDTIESLNMANGTMQVMSTLVSSAVTLAAGHNAVKQIVIIGDGQTEGWNLQSVERWKTVNQVFSQLTTPPEVVWRTLPLPTSIRNLTVSNVALTRSVVGTDREVGINVTVLNSGTETVTPDEVFVKVGPDKLMAKNVKQLEPGTSQVFDFSYKFKDAGLNLIEAVVSSRDDLPADDMYKYVVPVMKDLKVLIVDGNPGAEVFSRSSTFVSLALRPELAKIAAASLPNGASSSNNAGFLLTTEVQDYTTVAQRKNFDGYGVVILTDVPKLPQKTLDLLAEYVSHGGGLLILPGAKTKAEEYNLWDYKGNAVLPLKLGEWKAVSRKKDSKEASPLDDVVVDTFSFAHDALRNLRNKNDISTVAPQQYWFLDEGLSGAHMVAGRFTNNDPFFAIKPLDKGTVALSAIPFDTSVSDIVSKRSFVPLVHEIVYFLSRPITADLNVSPSDGATLLLAPEISSGKDTGGTGLVAMYFPKKGLGGMPVKRYDSVINFDWGGGSPDKKIPGDNFSARWIGSIVPPKTADYTFKIHVDDRATLKIGSDVIMRGGSQTSKPIKLIGGESYAFELTYEEDWGGAAIRLSWIYDGKEEIVPASAFSRKAVRGAEGSGDIVSIKDPSGQEFFGEIYLGENGLSLRITHSLMPGLYKVDVPTFLYAYLESAMTSDKKIIFNVASGVAESSMSAITLDETESLRKYISISTATKLEDVMRTLDGQAFGKEIWRMLAICVLILLIAEVVLTRWIAIQRKTGEQINVDFKNDKLQASEAFKDNLRKVREEEV